MKQVLLRDVATIERAGVDPAQVAGSTPYIGLEHIERGGRITGTETVESAAIKSTKFRFTAQHLLFGKLRPNLGKIARPNVSGVCSTDILPVFPGPNLDRDYLFHFLSQPKMIDFAASRTSGANLPRLSPASLGDFEIPLPPLDEQRRIAAILDQADDLRMTRRRAANQIGSLVQSIFADRFGHPGELLTRWPTAKLGEELDFLTSGSRGWAKFYADSGEAFLRIQNVKRDALDLGDLAHVRAPDTAEAKRTLVQPGDVLLSITADLGRTAVIPESLGTAYINQHLAILRCGSVNPRYLSVFLTSPIGQRGLLGRNRQGVKAGLNFDDIRSLLVPMPPIEAQVGFAAACQQADELRAVAEDGAVALQQLFGSVQSRAFAGQL